MDHIIPHHALQKQKFIAEKYKEFRKHLRLNMLKWIRKKKERNLRPYSSNLINLGKMVQTS